MNKSQDGRFKGQEVRLRAFEPADAPALLAYLNHPELEGRQYIPGQIAGDFPLSLQKVETVLHRWGEEKKAAHLAVERLADGALAGHAECEWEWDPHCPFLAVTIAPPFWRQGYGLEAARLLLRYLFEDTPAHNVSCWAADWNEPALAFARKLGFKECGRFRRDRLYQGRYSDGLLFELLRPEWQAQTR
jgi:RimJ/RimL family protein N-acetyltransferase